MIQLLTIVWFLLGAAVAHARVERVDVVSRADVRGGQSFGGAGPYERIRLRVFYVLDPKDPHNRLIVDLDRAPRNALGQVELSGDVDLLRPNRAVAGNDVLLISVPNRGQPLVIRDADLDDWYLRRGFTIAEVAWQFDVRPDPSLLQFTAPVARGIRGDVRSDFIVEEKATEHTISHFIGGEIGGIEYPVADRTRGTLTERDAPLAPRRTIPRKRWRFSSDRTIQLDEGFVPGKIYEVIYPAVDPAVAGTGFAAVRDFAAYCKNDPSSLAHARHVYGMGISQTGRFLRHFVWQGFNADEAGRQVFDALLVYIAGPGRGSFNQRFAQPSRDAQPLAPAFYAVDMFPFTDEPVLDAVTGVTGGLLDRAKVDRVVPKIFYVNTAYEYWSRGGSLIHTTPDGKRDIAPPATTRIYAIAGYSHVPGRFPPEVGTKPERGQQPINWSNLFLLRHGFAAALDAWVRAGVEPPPSRYPRIADGTLVKPAQLALRAIEGVAVPRIMYEPYRITSTAEPPVVRGTFTALVPQIGADGNELAGVRAAELEAPLATYTGWNLRHPDIGFPDQRASFIGGFIAWPKATIVSRYRDRDGYLGRLGTAALTLIDQRFLVPEDLQFVLRRGRDAYEWAVR